MTTRTSVSSTLTAVRRSALLLVVLSLLGVNAQAGLLDDAKKALGTAPASPTASPAVPPSKPIAGDLISMATSGLGITNQQATGGLGALFKVAQGQLSSGDFGTIASAVPNMNQLLGAAPAGDSSGGGLLSQAGGLGKSLGGASYLNSAFQKLGLSPELIGPLANIAVQYLQVASPEAATLLQQVTGGLI